MRAPQGESLRLIAVPLGFGLVSLALLVYDSFWSLNPLAIALAAASLIAVMLRLTLTFRENVVDAARLARRGEDRRADRARQPPRAGGGDRGRSTAPPVVLALFDLDGFKHYNDTFGHPAGDALLVRLGSQPRRLPGAPRRGRSGWAATSSAC